MRFIKTLTIEIHEDAQTIGQIWDISEERAEELKELLAQWIAESNKWSEIYKRIFKELDGNEAIFIFGLLNYLWGEQDGQNEALRAIAERIGFEGDNQ